MGESGNENIISGKGLRSKGFDTDHEPVLLEEILHWLAPRAGERYVDGTLGLGGIAAELLRRSIPDGALLGIDCDEMALATAQRTLGTFGERVIPSTWELC